VHWKSNNSLPKFNNLILAQGKESLLLTTLTNLVTRVYTVGNTVVTHVYTVGNIVVTHVCTVGNIVVTHVFTVGLIL